MKKHGALLLITSLLVSLTLTAYAVPDRMTTTMLQTILTGDSLSFVAGDDTDAGNTTRLSIYDAAEHKSAPIDWWDLDVFGTPVKTAAQALTAGDVETMSLTSFVSIAVSCTDPDRLTDEEAVFHFVNTYPLNLNFVAVVGALKDSVADWVAAGETIDPTNFYDWQALRAEPVDPDASTDTDDGIRVHFTKEALAMINHKDAVIALLCEVKAGSYAPDTAASSDTPSKTLDDLTTLEIVDGGKDSCVLDVIPRTTHAQQEFDQVYQHIEDKQLNVISYFDPDVQIDIAGCLPDGFDPQSLEMNEFADCICHRFDYDHGNVTALGRFPTEYAAGAKVVAMVGVFTDDGRVIWTPQAAEVDGGAVRITFTQNILTRMEGEPCCLMILNEVRK